MHIDRTTTTLEPFLEAIKNCENVDNLPTITITLKRNFITINFIVFTAMVIFFSLILIEAIFTPNTDIIFAISSIFLVFLFIFGIYQEIKEQRLTLFYRNVDDPFYCELNPVNLKIISGSHEQVLKWQEIKFVDRKMTYRSTPAHIVIHSRHNIYLYHSQLPVNYRKLFWVFHDYWLRANHRPIVKIL